MQDPNSTEAPEREARRHVGQFFTPGAIAGFMADQLELNLSTPVRVLDAGAGTGALTLAFLTRRSHEVASGSEVVSVESDGTLVPDLRELVDPRGRVRVVVEHRDFLAADAATVVAPFTHALLNPPYRRLFAHHEHWPVLRNAGVAVPNLYAAFIWLALEQLEPGGQLVAIVPRSFCNGSRFAPFRRYLRQNASIERIHVFDSRVAVFSVDSVLQETIVIGIRKRPQAQEVRMSWTSGRDTSDVRLMNVPANRVLGGRDPEGPIRLPASPDAAEQGGLEVPGQVLGEHQVSVGSVVDFRLAMHVRAAPEVGAVPLVDSRWRRISSRQRPGDEPFARWMIVDAVSAKHLRPIGNYVVVKRVSPKEQRPRLRAVVLKAEDLDGYAGVAFENHVCVIHDDGAGLALEDAEAMAAELSTLRADEYLRELSGSTQINVTDIRALLWGPGANEEGAANDGRLAEWKHGSPTNPPDDHLDLGVKAIWATRP